MMAKVYNKQGEAVGEIELPDDIFNRPWNPNLVHQVITAMIANRRQPLAHTKGRGEVRGGGKKPWRQKGTGRARHGSIRSPIWRGGGVTFGPTKEKIYAKEIPKKMRKAALYSALSQKLRDGELRIIDSLKIEKSKTRELRWLPKSTLLVPAPDNKAIYRASANLQKVKVLPANSLNTEDVLKYKNVLIDKEAVGAIK